MKNKNIFKQLLIFVILFFLVAFVATYKHFQRKLGHAIYLADEKSNFYNSNLNSHFLDRIIEDNKQTWKLYIDSSLRFRYPVFLSRFRRLKDPYSGEENTLKSSYYRSSNGNQEYGRSFSLVLYDPFPDTKYKKTLDWIQETKRNILELEEDEIMEMEVQEIDLGKTNKGYLIQSSNDSPSQATVYFKMNEGIRALKYHSYSDSDIRLKDYEVFRDILKTMSFESPVY